MTSSLESHLRLCGSEDVLLVRRWPGEGAPVLYVHGGTFPSALSVGYRFGGRSWADDLNARGFDVWALDFIGFGGSTRPNRMREPAAGAAPIGRAAHAVSQIAAVVDLVRRERSGSRVHLIAHSWGSIVVGLFASRSADAIGRLVMFGPIARREVQGLPSPDGIGAWRDLSIAEQLHRFVEDVPSSHPQVLIEPELADWGPAYLATDTAAGQRVPPSVRIPSGPQADIIAAMSGQLAYEPRHVLRPTLIVRGAWDSLCRDTDAAWLIGALGTSEKADIVVPAATHLMHLERGREALFGAAADWLLKDGS